MSINDEPIFQAQLRPHRSMTRKATLRLLLFIAILWGGLGLYFLSLGAWPVFGFFGLDIILVVYLFWLNMREGKMREEIHLSRTLLRVRRIAASGRAKVHEFNPFGTKFDVSRHDEIGITKMALSSHEAQTTIGDFLNPADKESFATAFSHALAKAKR